MANTKSLTREERKQAKRQARKTLSATYDNLTPKELKRFRAWEKTGVKAFIASQKAESA